jgi:peroxiredoxin
LRVRNTAVDPSTAPQGAEKRVFQHPARFATAVQRAALFATLSCVAAGSAAADGFDVRVDASTSIAVERHAARGEALVVILPSEHGLPAAVNELAAQLAALGIEAWVADPLAAYFLNATVSGVDAVPDAAVVALIEHARTTTPKQIYLLGSDRGAALALRGARAWQQKRPDSDRLGGAILVSPSLLTQTPEAGQAAAYDRIAGASNLPVFVLQPKLAVGSWQLGVLRDQLTAGGSAVTLRVLPDLRDRYFFRPDATAAEQRAAQALPGLIRSAVALLAPARAARAPAPLSPEPAAPAAPSRRGLVDFRGDPRPPPLALPDRAGRRVALSQFRGRVVLVNFWASWCPPCVHEMPSMQKLRDRLRTQPFTLLAVNMAEPDATVDGFMKQHGLDFAVLMDRDGAALKEWKVMAFPTSFVIDKAGRIRYGVFGAIDWLETETLNAVTKLVSEN